MCLSLAAGGEDALVETLERLRAEVERTLALLGVTAPDARHSGEYLCGLLVVRARRERRLTRPVRVRARAAAAGAGAARPASMITPPAIRISGHRVERAVPSTRRDDEQDEVEHAEVGRAGRAVQRAERDQAEARAEQHDLPEPGATASAEEDVPSGPGRAAIAATARPPASISTSAWRRAGSRSASDANTSAAA